MINIFIFTFKLVVVIGFVGVILAGMYRIINTEYVPMTCEQLSSYRTISNMPARCVVEWEGDKIKKTNE